jgi:peptidoglycan/LPS O-acetylase OafA/YrhL
MPYVLFWLAFRLPFQAFDRHGDYSYGIYIYAFPVQQMLSLVGANRWGLGAYFVLSLLGTLPLAALSYHLVEKPCLRWKDWRLPFLRRIASATVAANLANGKQRTAA